MSLIESKLNRGAGGDRMLERELIKWLHSTPVEEIKGYAYKLEGLIEEYKVDAEQYALDEDIELKRNKSYTG